MNSPTLDIQQRIEEGALRLFSRHGYIGTSMRMVAKEAYASLGSIYYYYEDKEALFRSLVEPAIRGLEALYALPPKDQDMEMDMLDPVERKRRGYSKAPFYQYIIDHAEALRLVFFASAGSYLDHYETRLNQLSNEATIRYFERYRELHPDWKAEVDPAFVDIYSAFITATIKAILQRSDTSPEELARFCQCHEKFSLGGWRELLGVW